MSGIAGDKWDVVNHHLDHDGRRYQFCSSVCKWIFELEPDRYKGHTSIIDRAFDGTIPAGDDAFYEYMGQSPEERGVDGYDYQWIDGYDVPAQAAE